MWWCSYAVHLGFLGSKNKKAPENVGGAWKRIWKTLSDHAPLAYYDDEDKGHELSPWSED